MKHTSAYAVFRGSITISMPHISGGASKADATVKGKLTKGARLTQPARSPASLLSKAQVRRDVSKASKASKERGPSWQLCLSVASVSIRQHPSAYVSIRQHTSAYVSIRQHTSAYVSIRQHTSHWHYLRLAACACSVTCQPPGVAVGDTRAPAYVSIRQHTSAYVSIRQHTSAYVSIRQRHTRTCRVCSCSRSRQHTSAYVSIRQHTSADETTCRVCSCSRSRS
jgi:hypothetical protein